MTINKYCFHYSDTIPSIEPVTLPDPSLLPPGIVEREREIEEEEEEEVVVHVLVLVVGVGG
jgi:hypothetical protein